jgi:putative ABC transport system permease protein
VLVTGGMRGASLPFAYKDKVHGVSGVEPLYWERMLRGDDGDRYRFVLDAVSDAFPENAPNSWISPDPGVAEKWRSDRQGIMVGSPTMEKMGWKAGDQVTFHSLVGPIQARVSGHLSGHQPGMVIMHYEYLDALTKVDQGTVSRFCVSARSRPHELDAIGREIDNLFENSPEPTMTLPVNEIMTASLRAESAVPDLLTKIGMLIVGVTMMISMSTLSMSLRERRSEFGTLRAVGYTRGRVFALILTESMAISLIGGVIGGVVPFVLFHKQGISMGNVMLRTVTVSQNTCFVAVGVALLLGLVVAILPAVSTAKQDVIAALNGD